MTPVWTIVGSVIASVLAAWLIARMSRSDRNDTSITEFKTWKKHHEEVHKLEERNIENKLGPIEKRIKLLGERTHDFGQDIATLFAQLGMIRPKRRKREDNDYEDD